MADEAPPLRVGAALPDPPFEFMTDAGPTGFDVTLMRHIAAQLGRTWQLVRYTGADFNGIFAGLDEGSYDCVASDQAVWARPVGIAVARDGALLISEDGNGTIWRIAYRGGNR